MRVCLAAEDENALEREAGDIIEPPGGRPKRLLAVNPVF
jgi:hypothetical protein